MKDAKIQQAYEAAKARYAEIGVDTDAVLEQIAKVSLSLHCWQTDDVTGFENPDGQLSGGIQATGNYPGKARNIEEVRKDIEKVKSLLPGNHRLNIHAIYGDFGGQKVDRDQIEPKHFQSWIDWAKANNMKLDFNSTSFSHPKSGDQSLSNRDKGIRDFWIEHTIRSRKIADEMGKQLGDKACHNLWIHDGSKDMTVDRYLYRSLLKDSLDQIFAHKFANVKDAVESKVFGVGLESYTVGSHEFYMGYAVQNGIMCTLDMGHFRRDLRQDLVAAALHAGNHAARKPSGTLGQRPRGYPERQRTIAGTGNRMGQRTEQDQYRSRLLRRFDQPDRRIRGR